MINEKNKQTNKQRRYVAYRPACLVEFQPQILTLGKIYHCNKENSVNEKTFHERESTMLSIKEKIGTEEQRNGGTEERGNRTEEPRERKIEIHRNGGTQEQWDGGKGNKKLFLRIIVLTNFTNSYQSLDILIGFMRMQIMKRLGIAWITIGCCEVNTNLGRVRKNLANRKVSVHVPVYKLPFKHWKKQRKLLGSLGRVFSP